MPLDETLIDLMNNLLEMIRPIEKNLSDTELRCLIVASNLRGLAEALLVLEEIGERMDMRRTALGLLGTADWLKGDLETSEERFGVK